MTINDLIIPSLIHPRERKKTETLTNYTKVQNYPRKNQNWNFSNDQALGQDLRSELAHTRYNEPEPNKQLQIKKY